MIFIERKIMKRKILLLVALIMMCVIFSFEGNAQKRPAKFGKICGNPNVKCGTGEVIFQEHEIPFEVSAQGNPIIIDSEPFYAVILKSVKLNSETNCDNAFSENERLEIQTLFPDNKVFALKCSDAGDVFYTNVANDVSFIAVYASKTSAEAKRFLKTVQKTGKFKGANLRKMQAGINGT